jgi:hypothetical protein
MSNNKKKGSSSTIEKIAIGLIGAGIGFLAHHLFKEVTK